MTRRPDQNITIIISARVVPTGYDEVETMLNAVHNLVGQRCNSITMEAEFDRPVMDTVRFTWERAIDSPLRRKLS